MRLRELAGKEIVNLYDGTRLGVIGETDLVVDVNSGDLHSMIIPAKNGFVNLWSNKKCLVVPWEAVRKVGSEVIIIDLDS